MMEHSPEKKGSHQVSVLPSNQKFNSKKKVRKNNPKTSQHPNKACPIDTILQNKYNPQKPDSNIRSKGSNVKSKGKVTRKKLFASKSHRVGCTSNNLDIYKSDFNQKHKKSKSKIYEESNRKEGAKENQKWKRSEKKSMKKIKKCKAKEFESLTQKALTCKFGKMFSHRNSLSLQGGKGLKKGEYNSSQVSREKGGMEQSSQSMFRPINLKSSLMSTPSNRYVELNQISNFNSDFLNPQIKPKYKSVKENLTRDKKTRLTSKRKHKKKQRKINKIQNLEFINPSSKNLKIEINKNSNSLKRMSSTLNQIHLNYIFSQKKKKNLSKKFDIKYIYSNQTPIYDKKSKKKIESIHYDTNSFK
jgi:hypothetical protein